MTGCWRFRAIGCLLIGGAVLMNVACGQERSASDDAAVAQSIRDLDSTDYAVRQQATQRLSEAGVGVLPVLKDSLKNGSLEFRLRIVNLLARYYATVDEAHFEPVEFALDDIAQQDQGSLQERARVVLETRTELRQRLGAAAIRRLGGSVMYAEPMNQDEDADEVDEDAPADALGTQRDVFAVVINQDWTGGDEGLRHLRRLTRLRVLYRVKKSQVSDEAIADFQARMPGVSVTLRGPAYLGITPELAAQGCGIGRVQPGSAAAKAGIEAHDIITRFDDQPVDSFDQLIELISEKLPGSVVPISVERMGQAIQVKAELTGWPKDLAP